LKKIRKNSILLALLSVLLLVSLIGCAEESEPAQTSESMPEVVEAPEQSVTPEPTPNLTQEQEQEYTEIPITEEQIVEVLTNGRWRNVYYEEHGFGRNDGTGRFDDLTFFPDGRFESGSERLNNGQWHIVEIRDDFRRNFYWTAHIHFATDCVLNNEGRSQASFDDIGRLQYHQRRVGGEWQYFLLNQDVQETLLSNR